jgi:tRNA-splicing endonuclease subunit Sen15
MSLTDQVIHNLKFQHFWTSLALFPITDSLVICQGIPPEKLHPDDPSSVQTEYLLPAATEHKWTIAQFKQVFDGIKQHTGQEPTRIIMAMVTKDSTIVYYFVNNGLITPRKN